MLQHVIGPYGLPEVVLSDRGKEFTGELWRELSLLVGFHLQHTSPYHPQTNGLCERAHRTINNALRATLLSDPQYSWPDLLPMVLLTMNAAPSDATSFSPYQLLFGRPARLPIEQQFPSPPPNTPQSPNHKYLHGLKIALQKAQEEVRKHVIITIPRINPYNISDKILVRIMPTQQLPKLSPRWEGPHVVSQVPNQFQVTYYTTQGNRRTVHVNDTKPFYDPLRNSMPLPDNDTPTTPTPSHSLPQHPYPYAHQPPSFSSRVPTPSTFNYQPTPPLIYGNVTPLEITSATRLLDSVTDRDIDDPTVSGETQQVELPEPTADRVTDRDIDNPTVSGETQQVELPEPTADKTRMPQDPISENYVNANPSPQIASSPDQSLPPNLCSPSPSSSPPTLPNICLPMAQPTDLQVPLPAQPAVPTRVSTRTTRPPAYLQDYETSPTPTPPLTDIPAADLAVETPTEEGGPSNDISVATIRHPGPDGPRPTRTCRILQNWLDTYQSRTTGKLRRA